MNLFLWLLYSVIRYIVSLESHMGTGVIQTAGGIFCLIELVRPGTILGAPQLLLSKIGKTPAAQRQTGKKSLVVLILLLIVLGTLGWRRFQEGMINADTLLAVGGVSIRVIIPIVFIFLILRRVPPFRRMPIPTIQ